MKKWNVMWMWSFLPLCMWFLSISLNGYHFIFCFFSVWFSFFGSTLQVFWIFTRHHVSYGRYLCSKCLKIRQKTIISHLNISDQSCREIFGNHLMMKNIWFLYFTTTYSLWIKMVKLLETQMLCHIKNGMNDSFNADCTVHWL